MTVSLVSTDPQVDGEGCSCHWLGVLVLFISTRALLPQTKPIDWRFSDFVSRAE